MNIIVYNWKGGVGKTTIATHLFRYLAFREGSEWAFYDADPQRDGYSWLAGHDHELLEETTLRYATEDGKDTGSIITTDIDQALAKPNVIIDAPPREDLFFRLSSHIQLAAGDIVLVPVNGRLSIDGAANTIEVLADTNCRVIVVVNMTDPQYEFAKSEIAAIQQLGSEVYPIAIPRHDVIRKGEMLGQPAWEVPYGTSTHAVKALRGLCEWISSGADPDVTPENTRNRPNIWSRLKI